MKNYMFLYKYGNHYYLINDLNSSNLRYLVDFFAGDYKVYDQSLFINSINCYNASFVFNDLKNQILYIGCSEWEIFEEINIPDDQEFPNYVNERNSCKIRQANFIELAEKLMSIKKNIMPFAIIYRDDNNWIDCKGFDTKEEMELFVKNYKPEVAH